MAACVSFGQSCEPIDLAGHSKLACHIVGPHKDVTHVPHFLLHSDRVAVDGGRTCLVQAGGVLYLPSDGTRKHEYRGAYD